MIIECEAYDSLTDAKNMLILIQNVLYAFSQQYSETDNEMSISLNCLGDVARQARELIEQISK